MRITMIGTSFVGVVSASVYASLGHEVVGLDIDERKITSLNEGKVPFFEPGLVELLQAGLQTQKLRFTTDYHDAITDAELIFIAVGTPSKENGEADLRFVETTITSLAPFVTNNAIIAVKSTVPPGTIAHLQELFKNNSSTPVRWASVPEFLREGTAVEDTLHPDRIIIGTDDQEVADILTKLHQPFNAPVVVVKPNSAQLGKYAANAYLANRITFINQVADLCEHLGADVNEVIAVMSPDKRIGGHYWYPGFGYGGSCFPKDVSELAAYSRSVGMGQNLFNKMHELNESRPAQLLSAYGKQLGGWEHKKVAVLGLAFKPHTDDMREAPSLKTIPYLLENQATVRAYDPKALEVAPHFITDHPELSYHSQLEDAVTGVDVVIALIEWPEVTEFDFGKTRETGRQQWFIDARNQFSRQQVEQWGYNYLAVGRP